MKKLFNLFLIALALLCVIACSNSADSEPATPTTPTAISLTTCSLGEVEFTNSSDTILTHNGNVFIVSGSIDPMTDEQKTAWGSDPTHVVTLKILIDPNKTLKTATSKGSLIKVWSSDSSVENRVGGLDCLYDGEDHNWFHIVNAATKNYEFTLEYKDGTKTTYKLNIDATLKEAPTETE